MQRIARIKSEKAPKYNIDSNEEEDSIIAKALEILERRTRKGNPLTSPDLVRHYLTMLLAEEFDEKFGILYLDNQHRIMKSEILFTGTIDGASVYPRVVVRECLMINAAAVLFYHNHPSGMSQASDADINLTKTLKEALKLVDIRVLDHLIVGNSTTFSFAERGLI